jgi:hypothetical protein
VNQHSRKDFMKSLGGLSYALWRLFYFGFYYCLPIGLEGWGLEGREQDAMVSFCARSRFHSYRWFADISILHPGEFLQGLGFNRSRQGSFKTERPDHIGDLNGVGFSILKEIGG